MVPLPAYDPHLLEREVDGLWKARRLPPATGILGPSDGAVVHQFEGTFTPGEAAELVAQRAVAADADARCLAFAGRRAAGTLRWEGGPPEGAELAVGPLLRSLGVWVGGAGPQLWETEPRHERVEAIVGRLARAGIVVTRDVPMRCCPSCAAPRSPERIVYQEEEGDTYLVRFDLPWSGGVAHALVWVDAPWRLLGTTALLVHPELPYVVARYRRRDVDEVVFTSRSSLERFREWLPGGQFEVLEEHPGKDYAGRAYDYPLRHEFPMGGNLAPPAGSVLAVADVTDTGTGIVPLVPGHGGTDAGIAESHGVTGWPLITPKGQLDVMLVHKYAGLDLATANEFIVRDLTEGAAVFAQLRVRRGVPHCVLCGTPLLWMLGRAWCLEPGRLPADRIELYRRLLPSAPPILRVEVAPWPVSETEQTEEPSGVALLECSRCERLDALDGPPSCHCGGNKFPTRRRLLPALAGTFAAWARTDPFPADDSARIYLPERRRVPRFIHDLTAMAGVEGTVSNTSLTVLPTIPEVDLTSLLATNGADAVRAALIRTERSGGTTASFAERCVQERGRLERLWALTQEVLSSCDPVMISSFAQPIAGFLRDLEIEDRAILARWERVRARALADYDAFDPAGAHRRLFRFLESDLVEYREWIRGRLDLRLLDAGKFAALRTLTYILRTGAGLLAPITPYFAESVHRRFAGRTSLFETTVAPVERSLLDDDLIAAWDRWRSVLSALRAFRRDQQLPVGASIRSVALLVPTDDVGDKLRQDRPTLERLGHLGRVDVGSPKEAWPGRLRRLVPVESEVQRVYGAQASQIIHLLQRLPARKTGESAPPGELSVVIEGLSRQIPPSMVEYRETLPEGTIPAPWSLGEMYLEPSVHDPRNRAVPPPLSLDAFWLTRRLARRLRDLPAPANGARLVAIVSAIDPLASELRSTAEPLARYLGLAELRIVESIEARLPPHRITGRTRTGASWWVHVPGMPDVRARAKHRSPGASRRRVTADRGAGETSSDAVDYSDAAVIAREESVRELNEELDELLGAPLIGPTKVRGAWALGLQSVDAFRQAPFETLAELPGFGHTLAATLEIRLGGAVPPPRARSHRVETATRSPPPRGARLLAPITPAAQATAATAVPAAVAPPTIPPPAPPPEAARPAPPPDQPREPARITELAPVPEMPLVVIAPSEEPPLPVAGVTAAPEVEETSPPTETEVFEPPVGKDGTVEPSRPTAGMPLEVQPNESGGPALLRDEELPSEERVESSGAPRELTIPVLGPEENPTAPTEPTVLEPPMGESAPQDLLPPESEPATIFEPTPEEEPLDVSAEPAVAETPPAEPELAPTEAAPLTELPIPIEPESEAQPAESALDLAPAPSLTEAPLTEAGVPSETPPSSPAVIPEAATSEVAGDEVAEPPAAPESREGPQAEEPIPTPPALEPAAPPEPKVVPTAEPPPLATPPPAPEPVPARGGIELQVGGSVVVTLQPFLEAADAGLKGICIVRESPERIGAQVGGRPVDVYWLSNLGRGRTLKPNDLPGISAFLTRQLNEEKVTIFFLEGIEYLVRIHGIDATLELLVEFGRRARQQEARVWVHLTPDLLKGPDLERIVAAFPRPNGSP
jgi:hypothetical protein